MGPYITPTQNPETIIIHAVTKALKSDSSPQEAAQGMINLRSSFKTQTNKPFYLALLHNMMNSTEQLTPVNKCLKEESETKIFVLLTTERFLQSMNVTVVRYI